jgi:two-component system, NtrC family, nitrogen regulation response regulator NtrX
MAKILIVDDEQSVRESLAMTLRYERHETIEAPHGKAALATVQAEPSIEVVFCDVKMPEMDGLEVLEKLQELDPELKVIMISGHGTIETALEATRLGAFEFLEKPLDQDRVLLTLRNALKQTKLETGTRRLQGELNERWRIIGDSPPIQELRQTIERIAPTDARVLITGENGTGKELVARNLHFLSQRADQPFVDLNCAALPRELIESELFGYEKGAFTGAETAREGRFEQADGGTLFLDEIGDMDLEAQAKVLRVLETAEVQRVGSKQSKTVDVRVIAATNKDLHEEVGEGRFREDLLYRLEVIPIIVAPLRERAGDLGLLLERFLEEFCARHDLPKKSFDAGALKTLMRWDWPGNVRELRNFVERAVLLVNGTEIAAGDLERLSSSRTARVSDESVFDCATYEEFKATSERLFLQKKLNENGWNIKRTAESLGMQRSNLYKKIDRYQLK